MKSKFFSLYFAFLCFIPLANAQPFTHQDSLRGSITPERIWWDLTYYDLDITVNPSDSLLSGSNKIYFTAIEEGKRLQFDLQSPMKVESVTHKGKSLKWTQDGYSYFVEFKKSIKVGEKEFISITYSGKPQVSPHPPWSGGITWKYDTNGNPFIATSVQGEGASLWWPCKDHMYDEPDSMRISITVPKPLIAVSNGRLVEKTEISDNQSKFSWIVSNPINNYGVNINIGDYVHFNETYEGEKGKLDCDYWVLSYNLDKAKEQFKDVPKMLKAFEHWFGPYPFYEDSYKLVEVPYLGMEHQSSVTYGNGFKNGYRGTDLSATGWGLLFDFIIIHESGHEWFANNITYKDMADMWIHESFTNYSESLFLEFYYGKQAGADYVQGLRKRISNDSPIIAPYHVNASGSGDMYYKGANMLHTIRQIVDSDSVWRNTLRGLNKAFYHKTVKTQEIESFINQSTQKDFTKVFDQYLRDIRIPVFQHFYDYSDSLIHYRWNQAVRGFNMPIKILVNDSLQWVNPTPAWNFSQRKFTEKPIIQILPDFYVIDQDLSVKSTFNPEKATH